MELSGDELIHFIYSCAVNAVTKTEEVCGEFSREQRHESTRQAAAAFSPAVSAALGMDHVEAVAFTARVMAFEPRYDMLSAFVAAERHDEKERRR